MVQDLFSEQVMQCTVADPIHCVGVGLHTGQRVSMTVKPAPPDAGVRFVRRDAPSGQGEIPALWNHVVETRLCTVLGNEFGFTVATVEHLMAALRGTGIDNALIEIEGPEVPIMDGSSEPFVSLIERAGRLVQDAKRRAIVVHRTIAVYDGDKYAVLSPDRMCRVSVEIDFPHDIVGRQQAELTLPPLDFRAEVSRARTFGFSHELQDLRRRGLARGGSVRNAVIVDSDRVLNEEGLRYGDEFARHKLLDSIGDLSLAGAHVLGHYHGYKPGHKINNALMRHLFADEQAWSYVRLDEVDDVPWLRRLKSMGSVQRGRLARWLSNVVA